MGMAHSYSKIQADATSDMLVGHTLAIGLTRSETAPAGYNSTNLVIKPSVAFFATFDFVL